ncbi:hypothetical protein [Roseateles chitinivorans]|uniref:hypothetical protein n=1 Tax=Roseateles chitinivorans TaxID=2917965 RepID=UPI003D665E01
MQQEIHQVAETSQAIVFMTLVYEEGDIGSAIGNVYQIPPDRDSEDMPTQLLATNDTLRVMWTSPSGHLWVASADGRVATTAPTGWQAPADGSQYNTLAGATWSVTALPRERGDGTPPNVTAIWGSADDDVHVGTFGGHLYRWDGRSWTQVRDGDGSSYQTIRAISGHGRDDVFAVGARDTLLHFDGSAWTSLAVPGAPNAGDALNGIACLADGSTLICATGDQGRLLHGSSAGFSELGRYPVQLVGIAVVDDKVLFATGNGVAELVGRDVRMIKETFQTSGVTAGLGRAFFIEPAVPELQFVELDPRNGDAPWWRYGF